MTLRTIRPALLLLLALLAGACLSSSDSEDDTRYYRVAFESTVRDGPPAPVSLVLRPFITDELLGREGILYQTSDVERGYWTSHEWIAPVAAMVRAVIQADLERSGMFQAVHLFENETLADVIVNAEVHEFGEVDRPDGWYGLVDISFEAKDAEGDRIVWRGRVRYEEKAATRTVLDTVRAISRALGLATDDLITGILAGVR